MPTRRQQTQEAAVKLVSPVLGELGVELVDVEYARRGRDQVLCLYLDREGGITLDELQEASRAVEKVLEVSELLPGHYRLEVSSPGIDRPWKKLADFAKNIGTKANMKLFTPLADGRRHVKGTVVAVEGERITFEVDEDQRLTIPYDNIARAKPEIDWSQMLKGSDKRARKEPHARRTS